MVQFVVSCGDNSAIESVPVSTRDARHGILAMPEMPDDCLANSTFTPAHFNVNRLRRVLEILVFRLAHSMQGFLICILPAPVRYE